MSERPTIGFIGVGLMGHGMASNLVTKGYPLVVLGHRKREPVEQLKSLGAAEAATAMTAFGWRWSTCGASTRPCIAVSREGAAPPLPCRQKSNAATISSSRSTPG